MAAFAIALAIVVLIAGLLALASLAARRMHPADAAPGNIDATFWRLVACLDPEGIDTRFWSLVETI